jgi:hypothetical protein
MQKRHGQKQKSESPAPNQNLLPKSVGLFDHIKHIQYVRDPKYYDSLSDEGKKSFNLFMILRGLSMNPAFIEYAAYLYRFIQIIPPSQFYKILIELYPRPGYKEFHRWIKGRKEKDGDEAKKEEKVIDLLVQKYEISRKEAKDYLRVFFADKAGSEFLKELVRGFGFTEKEVEKMI